jgi:hypothetical protein
MLNLLTWWTWYVTNQWLSISRTSYNDFIILRMLFETISRCLINSTNERTKKSRFNDVIDWTYVWIMFLRYKFMFEKTTMKHTIKRWLIVEWLMIESTLNFCFDRWTSALRVAISQTLCQCRNVWSRLRIENWKCEHRTIRHSCLLIEKHLFQWDHWSSFV